MKKVFYGALALALAGCGSDEVAKTPADQITFNDFEAADGWSAGAPVPSLTKEKAHSGTFSIRVAPGLDYSLGYNNLLGKISSTRLKKVKVQAWVFVPNAQSTAVLVTQVHSVEQNKDLLWDGLDVAKEAKALNKWVQIEKEITVPETATYTNQLLVYLWRSGSAQPTYLDDLRISRVE